MFRENTKSLDSQVGLPFITFIHCPAIISITLCPERNNTDVNVTFATVEKMDYLLKH